MSRVILVLVQIVSSQQATISARLSIVSIFYSIFISAIIRISLSLLFLIQLIFTFFLSFSLLPASSSSFSLILLQRKRYRFSLGLLRILSNQLLSLVPLQFLSSLSSSDSLATLRIDLYLLVFLIYMIRVALPFRYSSNNVQIFGQLLGSLTILKKSMKSLFISTQFFSSFSQTR